MRERLVFEAKLKGATERMDRDWEYFIAPTRDAYRETFTQEEIKELIAFYETPTGRKLTEFAPKLMEEFPRILMPWLTRVMGELMMKMREEFPELQKATEAPQQEAQEPKD